MAWSMTITTIAILRKYQVVPIIVIDEFSSATGTINALLEGGLPVAEITLRTPIALKVLEIAKEKFPQMNAGAGTVLSSGQARDAISAGASFLVSPGYSHQVLEVAQEFNVPYFPGVATATEIQRAISEGLSLLKFFPSEQLGGLATISALGSAFGKLEFMPSGGVDGSNYLEYLKHPQIPLVGGSWIAPRSDINSQNFEKIIEKTKVVVRESQALAGI
jgi:2-dehydro-3-deoxyphosphogluconate aldolase/(4S)-4-hydroxy-2-oxoglutarate aldolase